MAETYIKTANHTPRSRRRSRALSDPCVHALRRAGGVERLGAGLTSLLISANKIIDRCRPVPLSASVLVHKLVPHQLIESGAYGTKEQFADSEWDVLTSENIRFLLIYVLLQ